jgi:hypothetical protein
LPTVTGIADSECLVASRQLLVPLQCEFCSEGLSQLLQTVERIRLAYNPQLSILGVALTMFDTAQQPVTNSRGGRPGMSWHLSIRNRGARNVRSGGKPRAAGADL